MRFKNMTYNRVIAGRYYDFDSLNPKFEKQGDVHCDSLCQMNGEDILDERRT